MGGWGTGSRRNGFVLLLAATACADVAGGVLATSAVLVAAAVGGGAVTAVLVVSGLPWLVVGVPVGALVDRVDRRVLLVLANGGRAAAAGVLGVVLLVGAPGLPVLLVVVLVAGVLQVVVDTCAETAVPHLVEPAGRTAANGALTVATRLTNQFAGPLTAGVLHESGAVVPPLVAAGMCGLAAVITSVGSRAGGLGAGGSGAEGSGAGEPSVGGPGGGGSGGGGVRDRGWRASGLVDLLRNPVLRILVITSGATTLGSAAHAAALVLYAVPPGPLGLSGAQYGVAVGAVGLGATVGSLVTARLIALLGWPRLLLLSRFGWSAVFAAPLTGLHVPLVVLGAAGGVLGGTWAVLALSIRQAVVPAGRLGRVGGAYRALTQGCLPAGAAVGGAVSALWGPPAVFAAVTACTLLLIVPLRRTFAAHRVRLPGVVGVEGPPGGVADRSERAHWVQRCFPRRRTRRGSA